jgi:transmembrane sensor
MERLENTYIEGLIIKYWEGTLTSEEKRSLENWLAASEENASVFDTYIGILMNAFQEENLVDLHKLEGESWDKINPSKKKSLKLVYRVVSILAAACLLGVFLLVGLNQGTDPAVKFNYATADGISDEIELPDGSKIWLNKNSSVEYLGMSDHRKVILKGEGFFEVKTDSARVFEVYAGESLTRVLGTSFNIDAKDLGKVEIKVASGRVSFEQLGSNDKNLILEKGQQALALDETKELVELEDDATNILAWKTKMLSFNKTTLKQVAADVFEYSGLKLSFENDAIALCDITIDLALDEVGLLEDVLSFSLDIEIEKQNEKQWILKGKGCE